MSRLELIGELCTVILHAGQGRRFVCKTSGALAPQINFENWAVKDSIPT